MDTLAAQHSYCLGDAIDQCQVDIGAVELEFPLLIHTTELGNPVNSEGHNITLVPTRTHSLTPTHTHAHTYTHIPTHTHPPTPTPTHTQPTLQGQEICSQCSNGHQDPHHRVLQHTYFAAPYESPTEQRHSQV